MMHGFAVPDRMRFHMKGKLSHGESANSDMNDREKYISPFSTRYASAQMQHVFSEDFKFRTWRRLWISLAKAEKKLGLDITDEQIAELEAHRDDVNFEVAEEREREVRHDVMSHVYAYGKQCPKAEGIIHLGATSCYVGDNTDVIILREASEIILKKAAQVVRNLSAFAEKYTHLQPAQLTTVGKRATLWAYELCDDIDELEHRLSKLKLLGSKGTTGTQASFMELFSGDEEKVKKLESLIAEDTGFDGCVCVSGQTYSRKVDANFLATLSGFAQSAYKFANDLAYFSRLKRSRSRSRRIRSARPRCRTREIPCAPSVSAHLRDTSSAIRSTPRLLLRRSGLSARSTIRQTSASPWRKRSLRWIRYSIYTST